MKYTKSGIKLGNEEFFSTKAEYENIKYETGTIKLNNKEYLSTKAYGEEQAPEPPTKEAGLYVNGVLSKSWEQLIADGDVTITNGTLRVANTSLAGELVCDNVEGLTNLIATFYNCQSLINIDASKLNTSNVRDMRNMFYGCSSLTGLDLSSFDTSKAAIMGSMFEGCSSLTNLDISNFTFDKVINYDFMFIDVPKNCEILVKSQTEKDWITSRFTSLTDVKIKESNT